IARCTLEERHKRIVLERISERALRMHRYFDPELFGFSNVELELVERLRHGPIDVASLLYQLELPRHTAEAMLYVLVLTRYIDIGDTRLPVGATLDSRSPPSHASGEFYAVRTSVTRTSLPPNLDSLDIVGQLRRDLEALAFRLDSGDYYTLLGVARDAPLTAIRAAFTALVRRYHPDQLPPELVDKRPLANRVQARLTAAYRTLADEESRARYDNETPPPPSAVARERVARRSLAAEALRRAEQLLRRDRLDLAEVEASRALELDPPNPRCIALHAWIRALRPDSQGVLDQVLEALTQALDLDPMNIQTRFYRSQILKRLERLDEAVGEWQLITEMSPNHIDALRELRLWEMRRRSSGPPKSSQSGTHPQVRLASQPQGLLERLFKGSR
ncbi:MAG: J domain-containing protein, partial [Myxococcales bacterium]